MYRLTYTLTEDDLLAFNRFVEERFSAQARLNRYLTPLGTGFLFSIYLYIESSELIFSLLGGLLMSAIILPLWLYFLRSKLRRGVARWATSASSQREREAVFNTSGFRERTDINDCFFTWEGIDFVGITPTHLFVHESATSAFVVPRDHLDPGAVDLVRNAMPASKVLETGTRRSRFW